MADTNRYIETHRGLMPRHENPVWASIDIIDLGPDGVVTYSHGPTGYITGTVFPATDAGRLAIERGIDRQAGGSAHWDAEDLVGQAVAALLPLSATELRRGARLHLQAPDGPCIAQA